MLDQKLFSANLRRLMLRHEMGNKELAKRLKTHVAIVSYWRAGKNVNPTAKHLIKLAKLFDITIDSMFE